MASAFLLPLRTRRCVKPRADRPAVVKLEVKQMSPALLRCRGIRGATTVAENTKEAMLAATRELLLLLVERNAVPLDEITSVFFTTTPDLDAVHPALAARQLGWHEVALLCAQEIAVPGGLPRCIRVLLHVNTCRAPSEIRHVYLHDAVALRPGWGDAALTTAMGPVVEAPHDGRRASGEGAK